MAGTAFAFRIVCAAAMCSAASHLFAASGQNQGSPAQFSAEAGVAVEYDSNVTVDEVDLSSSKGDNALVLDAGVGVKKGLTNKLAVAASYDISQTFYEEFSQVDRQTHLLGTDLSLDLDAVDSGFSFFYIRSLLDGEDFLEMYRVSPSLSGFLSKKWFLRGAYVYSDKTIDERPDRDAITHSAEADLYYFMRGLRSYFNLGYRYKDEGAEDARLDYAASSWKLRYIQRFELFSRLAKLEFAWRYEYRDYSSETPSIGEDRQDERHRWRVDFEIPLVGRSALQVYSGYADYESNYPQADYDQTLVGSRFLYRW